MKIDFTIPRSPQSREKIMLALVKLCRVAEIEEVRIDPWDELAFAQLLMAQGVPPNRIVEVRGGVAAQSR